jgi:uncharacterized protein (TIGR02996 family)
VTAAADFLRAIRESPDDDALRLVYADWLEEGPDPARGEFIRAQVILARPETLTKIDSLSRPGLLRIATATPDEQSSRIAGRKEYYRRKRALEAAAEPLLQTLREREKELWRDNHARWNSACILDPCPPNVIYRRGFIEIVTADSGAWVRLGNGLAAEHPIQLVCLTTWPELVDHSGDPVPDASEFDVRVFLQNRWPTVKKWQLPEWTPINLPRSERRGRIVPINRETFFGRR